MVATRVAPALWTKGLYISTHVSLMAFMAGRLTVRTSEPTMSPKLCSKDRAEALGFDRNTRSNHSSESM